ncbi:tautomerase family protein [Halobacterium sp. KA-6]|uniref:tautomerase family protein n=1 Tax=Halobacterium sp. KA-6 TaxID=2896368 RepID=UPI001E4B1A9C|nr:tautomerase family protein [Halobacterium sp. KA-6]MCD2202486.1 tautomerase family protein [Halobacterium sp. KA-6]
MPLLQFDTDYPVADAEADAFADVVTDLYVETMNADRSYVAVVVRDDSHLSLGRAVAGRRVFCSADVREGRDEETKRAFATAVMAEAAERFDVPEENLKVVFTEHAGAQMHGIDRVGGDWG